MPRQTTHQRTLDLSLEDALTRIKTLHESFGEAILFYRHRRNVRVFPLSDSNYQLHINGDDYVGMPLLQITGYLTKIDDARIQLTYDIHAFLQC